MRKTAQLPFHFREPESNVLDQRLRTGWQNSSQPFQRKVYIRQELPRFIMKSVSDAFGLGFHPLIQLPHSGLSFVVSPVSHLKRRQALDEEISGHPRLTHTLKLGF
jgi:hypothetical protein